jgi:hypothetical protein
MMKLSTAIWSIFIGGQLNSHNFISLEPVLQARAYYLLLGHIAIDSYQRVRIMHKP